MFTLKRSLFFLTAILLLGVIFRFYNFSGLQMWTGDDEIITATIRHIIWDRSPALLIPNSALGFGMGPFFFYFMAVFYFLTSFNLVLVQSIASLLGILTIYVVYHCGKTIHSEKLGLIASFLYASSFLLSLFDRRLWPLSLGPFLSALTIFALGRVIKKEYKYMPLLAICAGFAFHSDLYLLVLVISIVICWFMFRFPIRNRYTFLTICVFLFFFLPFGVAEIKYNGAVSGPVLKSITKPLTGQGLSPERLYTSFGPADFIDTLARSLFTNPSERIDSQWCHGYCDYPKPLFSPFPQLLVVALLATSLGLTIRNKFKRRMLVLPWVILGSFIFGLVIFNKVFRANFNQLYFLVVFPSFLLLTSLVLLEVSKKSKLILPLVLLFYVGVNFYALVNSSIKYPLNQKLNLIKASLVDLSGREFSLVASEYGDIQGGGWTELYNLQKQPPVKSYWYVFVDWMYAAYSLYPVKVQQADPELIVVIQKSGENLEAGRKVLNEYRYKDIELKVIDNSNPL